jgi:superoxide reductase
MNRRSFIHLGLAGTAASIITPTMLVADTSEQKISDTTMAGGVYYTKESPGRWAKKANSHSPVIQKTDSGLHVVTSHPMNPQDHWIIKHVLLDKDFNFIAENIFDPEKDKAPISDFAMPQQTGVFYALSVCNLHDTWMSAIKV